MAHNTGNKVPACCTNGRLFDFESNLAAILLQRAYI